MKHLKGKSEETILEDFKEKYKIGSYEWEKMVKYIKRPKLGKHFVLVWGLFLVLIGLCFVINICIELGPKYQFPFIFIEVNGFFERFVNIIQVTLMLGIGSFLAIFPWFKIAEVYNWGE